MRGFLNSLAQKKKSCNTGNKLPTIHSSFFFFSLPFLRYFVFLSIYSQREETAAGRNKKININRHLGIASSFPVQSAARYNTQHHHAYLTVVAASWRWPRNGNPRRWWHPLLPWRPPASEFLSALLFFWFGGFSHLGTGPYNLPGVSSGVLYENEEVKHFNK